MKTKYILILSLFFIFGLSSLKGEVSLPASTTKAMLNEADDWIDDMPEGMQDKISDAVAHALYDSDREINYFRNFSRQDSTYSDKITIKEVTLDNGQKIRIYSKTGRENTPQKALLYLHGGGWTMGSLNDVDLFCNELVYKSEIKVISISYPLSPDFTANEILNKILSTLTLIKEKDNELGIEKDGISLGGDGAGGNLALAAFFSLINKKKGADIKSLVLFYPFLTLNPDNNTDSWKKYGRGYGLDRRLMEYFLEAFSNPQNDNNSKEEFSPLGWPEEILKQLPPTLIISAERDIIIDEGRAFGQMLKRSGVKLQYIEFPGSIHGFITDKHQATALKTAVELTIDFLR